MCLNLNDNHPHFPLRFWKRSLKFLNFSSSFHGPLDISCYRVSHNFSTVGLDAATISVLDLLHLTRSVSRKSTLKSSSKPAQPYSPIYFPFLGVLLTWRELITWGSYCNPSERISIPHRLTFFIKKFVFRIDFFRSFSIHVFRKSLLFSSSPFSLCYVIVNRNNFLQSFRYSVEERFDNRLKIWTRLFSPCIILVGCNIRLVYMELSTGWFNS